MARSIWTGVISFGLVSVPVGLYSATKEHDVSFHQFQKGSGDRIRYQRVNERTGKEVDFSHIVKGADVGKGRYVMLDGDELDSVAPGRSRSLDVHAFVDLDEIDPIYYQKTYYLAPASEETAKTYALLRDAMGRANRAAIATLVMRGKEYLAAVRPDGELLVLETMYFADEIRDPSELAASIPSRAKPRPEELNMAQELIDSMTRGWNPAEYHDTYTGRVNQLIAAKKKGAEVTVAEEAPVPTNVVDLMDALRASVDTARGGRSAGSKRATGAKKTTSAARKTAPKAAPKKAAPTKAAPKRAAPTKGVAKKAAAKKAVAKKAAAKKTAPGKRTAVARKTASGKRAARKAA